MIKINSKIYLLEKYDTVKLNDEIFLSNQWYKMHPRTAGHVKLSVKGPVRRKINKLKIG